VFVSLVLLPTVALYDGNREEEFIFRNAGLLSGKTSQLARPSPYEKLGVRGIAVFLMVIKAEAAPSLIGHTQKHKSISKTQITRKSQGSAKERRNQEAGFVSHCNLPQQIRCGKHRYVLFFALVRKLKSRGYVEQSRVVG
jgi:hypothetical protein